MVARLIPPLAGDVEAPIGDLVDGLGIRSGRMMADAECDGPQGHRAIRMGHGDEHHAERPLVHGM